MRWLVMVSLLASLAVAAHDVFGAEGGATTIAPANPTTLLIRGIVETVGAAGDAIGKITDGVRKLVIAGDTGWQAISARQTRASLVELSANLTGLAAINRAGTIPMLEAYIRQPSAQSWPLVTSQLGDVLSQVDSILNRLSKERSELVLQPAYAKLQNTLRARASLLAELQDSPAPLTKVELAELRTLLEKYRMLVAQIESARDELNEYVRGAKS